MTPQRLKALAALEGRQGTIRELAQHAEVSDAVLRGLVHAGALEAVTVEADRPLECPDPDFAPPDLNDEQRAAAASLSAAIGKGFDPVLLDGVTGSGKTEVYFEAVAEALAPGQAGAGAAARDRADRAVPQALPGALRLRPGRLAFRPALVAAPPRLAGDRRAARPRSRSAPARRCSCPTRNLGLIVVDEAHEPSFKQEEGVQYHARDVAVMRGQVRGRAGDPVVGDPGDREPAHGRDRPLPRGHA